MNRVLLILLLLCGPASAAVRYDFTQCGYDDGACVTGYFTLAAQTTFVGYTVDEYNSNCYSASCGGLLDYFMSFSGNRFAHAFTQSGVSVFNLHTGDDFDNVEGIYWDASYADLPHGAFIDGCGDFDACPFSPVGFIRSEAEDGSYWRAGRLPMSTICSNEFQNCGDIRDGDGGGSLSHERAFITLHVVPEPDSIYLFGTCIISGLLAAWAERRRSKRKR